MRLLVTGGAGYIGSVVTSRLLGEGHEVTVLDDLSKGHEEAIPEGAAFECVTLTEGQGPLRALLLEGTYDGVLHFAARSLVGESMEKPSLYYESNVLGTLNLLEAMRGSGVGNLVFSSTAAVYGEPTADLVPLREDAPTLPTNPYGSAKLAADHLIGVHARAHGLSATSLRYFNVAGASGKLGEDHDPETHLIPLVLDAAAGKRREVKVYGTDYPTRDGTAVRDYIHVEDLAAAHLLALEASAAGPANEHRVYNLGNGEGFSVREVVDAARKVTGREIEAIDAARRAGDPAILVASSEKIRRELGWKPAKPSLEEMIRDAWEWRLAHPEGYGQNKRAGAGRGPHGGRGAVPRSSSHR